MTNIPTQPSKKPNETNKKATTVFFRFWYVSIVILVPFYGYFFLGGLNLLNEVFIIGLVGLVPQIIIFTLSYKQANSNVIPLSKAYLTLIGGSLLLLFIWAGGCFILVVTSISGGP